MACPEDFEEDAIIEKVEYTSDGAGGQVEDWTTRKTIFCMVEQVSGGESIIGGRNEHSENFELTTHYDPSILLVDRVNLDGQLLKITRIENIDRKDEYMIIYCETGRT